MPEHFFKELRQFFEDYKKLEQKSVKVEDFGDKATALNIIRDARDLYKRTFKLEQ
jgi:inorganic pyrophosphatase